MRCSAIRLSSSGRPIAGLVAGELTAIVADDHLWLTSSLNDTVQLKGNPQAGKGRIGDESDALPSAIVHDRKQPEPATIGS